MTKTSTDPALIAVWVSMADHYPAPFEFLLSPALLVSERKGAQRRMQRALSEVAA